METHIPVCLVKQVMKGPSADREHVPATFSSLWPKLQSEQPLFEHTRKYPPLVLFFKWAINGEEQSITFRNQGIFES